MKGLVDYHVHTSFSDGAGLPTDYTRQALTLGLEELAITDHQPLLSRTTDWHLHITRLPEYVLAVDQARREFPQLRVLLGIELEYWPGIEPEIRQRQAQQPWDFCLGSVHFIGDFGVDNPQFLEEWSRRDPDQVWAEYFNLLAQAAATGLYDSLAHPDLVKKFGFYPKAGPSKMFGDLLDAVQGSGTALEVNSSGLFKPCKEIYPCLPLLTLARQKGIPITLGSDAHRPQSLGQGLGQAVQLARTAGYRSYLRFAQRQAREWALPNISQ